MDAYDVLIVYKDHDSPILQQALETCLLRLPYLRFYCSQRRIGNAYSLHTFILGSGTNSDVTAHHAQSADDCDSIE